MLPTGIVLGILRLLIAFRILPLEGHLLAGYTAIAHVYMGILLAVCWSTKPTLLSLKGYWSLFWLLNAVEIASVIIKLSSTV